MRFWRLTGFAAALAALAAAVPAHAERLVVSLSAHRVLINSSFTGAEPVLFGVIERDAAAAARRGGYDVVVTVTGPRQEVVTRQKQRVLGVWVNARSRTFSDAPAYLAVLSNRSLAAIARADTLQRLQIGAAAAIELPANAPIGNYEVDVKLFADGALLARQTSAIEIVKVGFEQFIASAAREHGLAYGLATATLALLTGWAGAVVFRRD